MNQEIKLGNKKVTVIITTELASQIDFMHRQCPANTEWSGLLIYNVEEGNVEEFCNPEHASDYLELRAIGLYPMDFGDATFTSFEGDEKWLKAFQVYPQIDPIKPEPGYYIGKIHTHHNMSAFHSGTDDNDLYTTAQKLPMFLSLVVNYRCDTHCKLAIGTEGEEVQVTITRSKWKIKNLKDFKRERNKTKVVRPHSKTYTVLCDVSYEQEDWLVDQCDELSKKKSRFVSNQYTYEPSQMGFKQQTVIDNKPASVGPFTGPGSPVYKKMIDTVCELFTLGVAKNMTAYLSMQKVNLNVTVNEKDDYKKAIKNYFKETWFDNQFYNFTSITEVDVINMIETWAETHKNMFAHSIIIPPLIELKNEYKEEQQLLRTF